MVRPEHSVPAPDPLVDEIREIRREIVEQFGNDIDRLCDHLQELERQHPDLVLHPKDDCGVNS